MIINDSVEGPKSVIQKNMTTLNVSLELAKDEGSSEYNMRALRMNNYKLDMPQQRLDAIVKVLSETGRQQAQS